MSDLVAGLALSVAVHVVTLGLSALAPAVDDGVDTAAHVAGMRDARLPRFALEPQPDDSASSEPLVCAELSGEPNGRCLDVQGPSDNPDPHLARLQVFADRQWYDMIGLRYEPLDGDPRAPIAPWGRDDSLGNGARSALAFVWGSETRAFATCFEARPGTCDETEAAMNQVGARVVVGPIEVAANVPAWAVRNAVRATIEHAQGCYARARLDDATLAGSYRAVLRVRAGEAKVALQPLPELERATALRCCVEMALTELEAPTGTRATARYSFRLE